MAKKQTKTRDEVRAENLNPPTPAEVDSEPLCANLEGGILCNEPESAHTPEAARADVGMDHKFQPSKYATTSDLEDPMPDDGWPQAPTAGPTAETGEAGQPTSPAASSEEPSPAIAPSQVRQLNRHGHCGHCGNPHVAKYGEGKWKCVCGAGNL